MTKQLILCDCLASQKIDTDSLSHLEGVTCSKVHSNLCGSESGAAAKLIAAGNATIACQQEHAFFEELASEIAGEIAVETGANPEDLTPDFVDLRDRAGWSDEGKKAGPKMAALAADAAHPMAPLKTFDVTSEGLCLILGPVDAAVDAARQLAPFLSVTLLVENTSEIADLPMDRSFDLVAGQLKGATGSLGQFEVRIDQLQQMQPGGRGEMQFGEARNGGMAECDIILDLRGGTPLFPAPEKREGYLRADPGSLPAVGAAVMEASHLVGTFEKPFYLGLDPLICAHSRAGQSGCSKCLDVCPTSAIRSEGDHVDIDPTICAGCGSCAALCPSGAITFDNPAPGALFTRMNRLAETYKTAGGNAPRLLVHDASHGSEMISLSARFDRGLPADVIPMELEKVSGFGHAEMLGALAVGFAAVDVLVSPKTERDALDPEVALAQAMAGTGAQIRVLDPATPEALSDALYGAAKGTALAEPILPLGSRRQVARLAAKALNTDAEAPLPLPAAAPYGAVVVDKEACTLCLSCASLCPAGALGDNPDAPQLRFQEDACLQCGLCSTVCPENAITLQPQMDLSDAALSQRVIHEEEPFECIDCGKPFGVKSTIDKIIAKLEGKHSMFQTGGAANLIKMCDDCRVNAQYHMQNNPMAGAARPRVRTTDDYLSKRRDH